MVKKSKPSGFAAIVAENLRRLRESHEISAPELAEKLGVSRQTVYRLEWGREPRLAGLHLDALSRIFGVSISRFVSV